MNPTTPPPRLVPDRPSDWLSDLHDHMMHCVSAADEGEDYAVSRPMLDAMTALGLMAKVGRGKWAPTDEGRRFAAARRESTLPIDVRGEWYEVPIPVHLHVIALRDAAASPAEAPADPCFVTFENGHMKLDAKAFLASEEGKRQVKAILKASEQYAEAPAWHVPDADVPVSMLRQREAEAPAERGDEALALHWIDRYAAGIDDEPQMDRIREALFAPRVTGGRAEWTAAKPAKEGVYAVRGYSIGARYETAVVEVREFDNGFGCNLHLRNSEGDPDEWDEIARYSDRFQWKYLAPLPSEGASFEEVAALQAATGGADHG